MAHPKLPRLDHYVDRLNPSQRYLITEFVDNYEDGVMSRRDLIERVYRITGSVAAAAGTLLALGCAPATATPPPPTPATPPTAAPTTAPAARASRRPLSVAATDPAITGAGAITFPSGDATIMAYWARPAAAAGRHPAVMICHENRGTGSHYEDVARCVARAAVFGVYAENDALVNASIPAVEQPLRAAGAPLRATIYPGAGHAFYNDTGGSNHEGAATAAWRDTLDWFNTHLRGNN